MDMDTVANSEPKNDTYTQLEFPLRDNVSSRHNELESGLPSSILQGVLTESSSEDIGYLSNSDIEEPVNSELQKYAELPLEIPSRDNVSSRHNEVESCLSSSTIQGVVTESSSKDIEEPANYELKNDVDPSMDIPSRDNISLEVDVESSTSSTTPQNVATESSSKDIEEPTNPELENDAELPLEILLRDHVSLENDVESCVQHVATESMSEELVATPNSESGNDVDTFLEDPSSHTVFTSEHVVDSSLSPTNISRDSTVKWFRETEYSAEIKRLDGSAFEWMKFHMAKGGNFDFTPVIDDYKKHLDFLKEKYPHESLLLQHLTQKQAYSHLTMASSSLLVKSLSHFVNE